MDVQVVKNLTHKTGLKADPRDLKKDDKPIFITRISGVVEKVKSFEDRKGKMQTVFIGDFIAQGADGQTYSSEKLYLFKQLEEKLSATFSSGGDKAVEFSYDVFANYDEKSVTRYAYAAHGVTPTATSDRMAALMEKVGKTPMPTTGEAVNAETAKGGKK